MAVKLGVNLVKQSCRTNLLVDGGVPHRRHLVDGIREIFSKHKVPVVVQGPGPFFSALFTDKPVTSYRDTFQLDSALYSKFWVKMLDQGIRVWTGARGLWYLSAAHTDQDIDVTLDAISNVMGDLRS